MRSCAHKVHTPIGGRKDGRTDGRNDGKPKTMSLRFSSKRWGTIIGLDVLFVFLLLPSINF